MEYPMSLTKMAVSAMFAEAGKYGITMSALAREAGVTRVTLSNWRSGRTIPLLDAYLATRAALDSMVADKQRVG